MKLLKGLENKSDEEQVMKLADKAVHSGEQEAEGRPHHCMQLPERRLQQRQCQSLFFIE